MTPDEELLRLRSIEQVLIQFRKHLASASKHSALTLNVDGGRVGCMQALAATINLCRMFSFNEGEINALDRIMEALGNAEAGASDPLLVVSRKPGRPPVPLLELRQRGLIAAAVEAMLRDGTDLDAACRLVARRIVKLAAAKGVRDAHLWNAVRKWREHAAGLNPDAWDNIAYKVSCEQMTSRDLIGVPAVEILLGQAANLE